MRHALSTIRAFLAVPLPPPLRLSLAALREELVNVLPRMRWTHPETVHLTLRFFGGITADELEKIRLSMLSVAFRDNMFHLELVGLGAFPDARRPRVVWIGLTPVEPIQALYQSCAAELRRHGLPSEPRPFAPHLTIGRYREKGPNLMAPLAKYAQRKIGCLPVSQLVLYESRLRPDGPQHIPLFSVQLPEQNGPAKHHR